jgi:hypothetical protein
LASTAPSVGTTDAGQAAAASRVAATQLVGTTVGDAQALEASHQRYVSRWAIETAFLDAPFNNPRLPEVPVNKLIHSGERSRRVHP